jgi:transcriptional regulator with XRE-family HTH domain
MKKLVKVLDDYRLEKRISQENLAKELHVAFSTVNRWFNNRTNPSKIQTYHIKKLIKEVGDE